MEKFAFIIHPMDVRRDASRKYPVLKYFPNSFVEYLMTKISPKLMSHIQGVQSITGAQAEGWLIGCPLGPHQLTGDTGLPIEFIYDKIAQGGVLAAELGAKVVGLGAFTSVAGDAGISVAKRLEGIINVTSGNSYTVYTAVEGLLRAAELMEVDLPNARVAIIGATGSIGAVCAKVLSPQVGCIDLVGRTPEKLEALRAELSALPGGRATASISTDIPNALRQADLVLAVSSAGKDLIFPEDLKTGAVVCDVARPRDVSKTVIEKRDDVLVIEGGVIDVPGNVNFNFNFGFPDKTAYACMSETMLMALEGTYEPYTLGRDLTVEQVLRIGELAKKHGFKLAGFRAFETSVTPDTIARVRDNALRKKNSSAKPSPVIEAPRTLAGATS
ncbi:MAG: fatty aldehyde-rating acyl-ACP reductase [Abditibacteriota bacterium]|nr:fatty aldehyde-rating acyl-ACP reductase [Abditibacteriota bacterium]